MGRDRGQDGPDSEELDVSMTQEATVLFIPYTLATILGIAFFAAGTLFHTWKVVFVVPPIWFIAALATKNDRNGIRVFMVKTRLLKLWAFAHLHGGWSLNPPPPARSKPGM